MITTATNGSVLSNCMGNWVSTTPTSVTTNSYTTYCPSTVDLQQYINNIVKRLDELENKNKKESNKMFDSLTKNLKCGRAHDVRMSIYGPAFEGEAGNWYSVDTDGELTDVTDLLLDMDSYCFV